MLPLSYGYEPLSREKEEMMITQEAIPSVLGRTAYDSSHTKIGKVGQVYVDDKTGQPEWMTVRTGLFGRMESFVPLQPAEVRGDEVVVPFEKQQVSNAPRVAVDASGHVPDQDEARMYDYYGMRRPAAPPAAGQAMTRSEEQLRVGKETREAGRARLRKYVVTEDEQQTVPVRKETVRVEHEPITEQNRAQAMAGPGISEAEQEVVRQEERPVVSKETVPQERVRLAKDETTEQQTVGGKVRKERIDAEGYQQERRS
jgi:uncharacterized protein (TIGR02271 family)